MSDLGHDLTCEVDDGDYIEYQLRRWQNFGSINSEFWVRKIRRNGSDGGGWRYALYQAPKGVDLHHLPDTWDRANASKFLTVQEFREEMKE